MTHVVYNRKYLQFNISFANRRIISTITWRAEDIEIMIRFVDVSADSYTLNIRWPDHSMAEMLCEKIVKKCAFIFACDIITSSITFRKSRKKFRRWFGYFGLIVIIRFAVGSHVGCGHVEPATCDVKSIVHCLTIYVREINATVAASGRAEELGNKKHNHKIYKKNKWNV